jgi:hypothetical protein
MTFQKIDPNSAPRRLWALVGHPASGKSTFAMQMRGPILVVDADHRIGEVASLAASTVYALSERPTDNVLAEQIAACLRANMAASDVRTIVVDSLTAILAPLVTKAILDNRADRAKNKAASFMDKALAARLLADAISMWGTDVLYVYHLQTGRDANAQEVTTATVSRTELARLQRNLNMQLRVIQEGPKRGIHIDWARRGRSDLTLWDDTGCWAGMPERIEAECYAGLSKADQDRIEQTIPTGFSSPAEAIAWAVDFGGFEVLQHSRNAYDKTKAEQQPKTAGEMWEIWIHEVVSRKAEKAARAAQSAPAEGAPDPATGAPTPATEPEPVPELF